MAELVRPNVSLGDYKSSTAPGAVRTPDARQIDSSAARPECHVEPQRGMDSAPKTEQRPQTNSQSLRAQITIEAPLDFVEQQLGRTQQDFTSALGQNSLSLPRAEQTACRKRSDVGLIG
jgi:hypothetical protein